MAKTAKTAKKATKSAKTVKAATKKTAKKASGPARKTKAPAKPKLKLVTAPNSKRGFMWKLLENKEKRLKEQEGKSSANPFDRSGFKPHDRPASFQKFMGPRRRAG